MKLGDGIIIPLEVKHCYGVTPDSLFSYLSVEVPIEGGSKEWLELIQDSEYKV